MNSNPSVPVGRHDAVVAQSYFTTTMTEKLMLTLIFEVAGMGTVPWRGFFTDKALAHTAKTLSVLGFDLGAEDLDLCQIDGTDHLVGRPASIVVEEQDDDNGNVHTRVRWVNRRSEKQGDGDVAALSASLRKRAEAAKKQAEAQAAEGGGDTPF